MLVFGKIILGAVVGAVAGYLFHRVIGCTGGACPIWNSPLYAALIGAGIGAMALS